MNYPINDIFEGTGELLLERGSDVELIVDKEDERTVFYYMTYGDYNYLVCYKEGDLQSITRVEKEDEDGQD